jgi:mannose-6-phosphate isomerase
VDAGHELSLQMHERKDETSHLLSGRLLLTRGPALDELEVEEIGPGHTWRVEPGTVHSIAAIEDSEVLEVSTPHLDDVIRLRDRYRRTSDAASAGA